MTEYQLSPSILRRDGGTQPRAVLDETTILEYAGAMAAGDTFPPVVAFHDGETYWLADGFHRVNAALRAGVTLLAVATESDLAGEVGFETAVAWRIGRPWWTCYRRVL